MVDTKLCKLRDASGSIALIFNLDVLSLIISVTHEAIVSTCYSFSQMIDKPFAQIL